MDDKLNKPTDRTPRVRPTPMSNEEKLRRSMKGLSYTGASASGSRLPSQNSQRRLDMSGNSGANQSPSAQPQSKFGEIKPIVDPKLAAKNAKQAQASRKKVGGVVLDLETIQATRNQAYETKSKRNNIIIFVLSLLLVISLVYLVIAIYGYVNGKQDPNCKYVVNGEATWTVEGGDKMQFSIPRDLGSGFVYKVRSQLNINTTEEVAVTIFIDVKMNGTPIIISGLDEPHVNLARVMNMDTQEYTNEFRYQGTITGGGSYVLFQGIDFSDAPYELTSKNVTIEVTANVEKVSNLLP